MTEQTPPGQPAARPTPIGVLLADDQRLMREGLQTLLELEPDIIVAGHASDGEEAIAQALRLNPNVVVMDVRMPVLDGVAATRRLKGLRPEIQVLLLTTFDDDDAVFEGLKSGAIGYLLKDIPADELAEAVRAAARGESSLTPSVARKVVQEFTRMAQNPQAPKPGAGAPAMLPPDGLSDREVEVLRLAAQGLSNREIGEKLFIAEGTVKNHISNILSKLQLRDRVQAVLYARERGLLT